MSPVAPDAAPDVPAVPGVTQRGHATTTAALVLMACPVCGVDIVADVTLGSPTAVAVTADNLDAVPTTLAASGLVVSHRCDPNRATP
jgi:hypothetical protein